jgi:hypothetical protein
MLIKLGNENKSRTFYIHRHPIILDSESGEAYKLWSSLLHDILRPVTSMRWKAPKKKKREF